MIMKKILYTILGLAFFTSCNREAILEEVTWGDKVAPQFEVSTVKDTYKVGEKVTFTIDGDAGMLDFWSGEVGNDYEYRERRFMPAPDEILMQLKIRHQYKDTRTASTFQVLVSTDFDGDRSSFEQVDAATWTDITDRLGAFNDATQTNTEKINITDLREEGKPLYVAFKYVFDPDRGTGTGSWPQIQNVWIEAVTDDRNSFFLNGDLTSDFPRYAAVSVHKNPIRSLNRYYDPDQSSNILVIQPNATATVDGVSYTTTTYTEEYFVSVPYHVGETELEPDKPIILTNHSRPTISTFSYTFTQPGVYKVKFIGTDPSVKEHKETIKELEITVTE